MGRVALVIPWYGRKPWYWRLFEQSAARLCMDVIVVAERGFAVGAPNFRVVEMSLDELRKRAERALGCDVRLDGGYKLCDLKPMYGLVFADLLKGYDYWAFGDCDVVYGRKMNELLEQVLKTGPDVVSMRRDWVSGPFALMKNTKKVNELFMRADGWREMLAVPTCQGFDEFGKDWFQRHCFERIPLDDIRADRCSFGSVVWNSADINFLHGDYACEDSLKASSVRMDADGRLTCGNDEFAMYHFIAVKGSPSFVGPARGGSVASAYELTRDGYIPAQAGKPKALVVLSHRCRGWLAFAARLARGRENDWARIRRFIRRKLGVRKWWQLD